MAASILARHRKRGLGCFGHAAGMVCLFAFAGIMLRDGQAAAGSFRGFH
jgi:hypothetical protein